MTTDQSPPAPGGNTTANLLDLAALATERADQQQRHREATERFKEAHRLGHLLHPDAWPDRGQTWACQEERWKAVAGHIQKVRVELVRRGLLDRLEEGGDATAGRGLVLLRSSDPEVVAGALEELRCADARECCSVCSWLHLDLREEVKRLIQPPEQSAKEIIDPTPANPPSDQNQNQEEAFSGAPDQQRLYNLLREHDRIRRTVVAKSLYPGDPQADASLTQLLIRFRESLPRMRPDLELIVERGTRNQHGYLELRRNKTSGSAT
jgi:hypothetical protein